MKGNIDKIHLLLSSESDLDVAANIKEDVISNSKSEKLFGVTKSYKLTFDQHLSRICHKTSRKLSA